MLFSISFFPIQVMKSSQQSMMGMRGSPQASLEMVLKYLHSTGEILWYHDNDDLRSTVFHRPEALIDMLRAIFRHDFEEVAVFNEEISHYSSLTKSQFDKMKKDFIKRGLLTRELLGYLLRLFQLSDEAPKSLVNLIFQVMLKFGLCFELNNPAASALVGSSNIVQFPWFFSEKKPKELESKWPDSLPNNMFEISIEIAFSNQAPPNFFEKLSVKIQNFLTDTERLNWRDGVFATFNQSSLFVRRERRNSNTLVTISARSATNLQELWSLVLNVRRAALLLLKDWPLAKYEMYLVCLHCILNQIDDAIRYPGHVLEQCIPRGTPCYMKCCEKLPDDEVPTAFVFPLDESSKIFFVGYTCNQM